MARLRDFLEKINISAQVAYDEAMAAHTTLKIGGPAEALVAPATREDLLALLGAARAEGIAVHILGGGANLLVGDRGIRGLVVETRRLGAIAPLAGPSGPSVPLGLEAEAGAGVDRLCEVALAQGLAGLETFYGMPGSLGGAVYMNARCYEVEMADRLLWVESVLPDGSGFERRPMDPREWAYKASPFQEGGPGAGRIILASGLALKPGNKAAIEAVMGEKRADREAKGHYRLPSAGSTFKNDRGLGRPTGKILDDLGLRGRAIGGARVSDWHANIFVNSGGATAADMRALIELAQDEARKRLGISLEPEVVFVGDF